MSIQDNKALARRYFEEYTNARNTALAGEILTPDVAVHGLSSPTLESRGIEELAEFLGGMSVAFPDLQITIDDMIAEADKVVVLNTVRGANTGEYQGMPPTGRQIALSSFSMFRIEDGRIAEIWNLADTLGMMQQMGLIPTPEVAAA